MYFNHILTSGIPRSSNIILDLDVSLRNLWTSFIPIYYIIGLVPLDPHDTLDTFDSLYSHFSPTCTFIPAFGNTYSEKHRFSLRLRKPRVLDDD